MKTNLGALPMQEIKKLIQTGSIKNARLGNIKPGSLDLTISPEIHRVEGVFLPRPGEIVRDTLKYLGAIQHDLDRPLEKDVTYLVRIKEEFKFSEETHAYGNPKSSTGRNDVQVRILADGISRYDVLPPGFIGKIWMAITPKSFPIKITAGESLSQLRVFNQDTTLNQRELFQALRQHSLLWNKSGSRAFKGEDLKVKDRDGSIILTIDVETGLDVVGWECLGEKKVLDFSKTGYYSPLDFFRPLHAKNGAINMHKNGFYILHAKERVRVPPHLACEMIPMDARSGEFRTHYAGFIDPGYGWGKNGEGKGRQLVLEIRPFEDLVLRDEQPAAKIKFEKMSQLPETPYDALTSSNYTFDSATPRLSKHFRVS